MSIPSLIEKLKQVQFAHLFSDEVDKLDNHLRQLEALSKRSRDDKLPTELIRRIGDAVNEAEDAIDAYVTQKNPVNAPDPVNQVRTTVQKIEAALKKIEAALQEIEAAPEWTAHTKQARQRNVVVGMEYDTERFSTYLMEESTELQVLSIVGMAGLGKTVLAQKIFHNARIVNHFPVRIWVYVSQAFTPNEIFLHILKEFTLLTDDIKGKTDQELADLVVGFLENKRFLLVMDDLWSLEDWDRLKVALPMSNEMGRVLITTRFEGVARHANFSKWLNKIRFLTRDEGFQLLQLEAWHGRELPLELRYFGLKIADRCKENALAIVLIGGILVKEFSSDMIKMAAAWQNVSQSLISIKSDDPMKRITRIIAMSYEKLPYHLRECFLYLGIFPEDFEIPVWKLIRVWIAEGFIQQNSDHGSLEETAENYLQELIDRNLVRGVRFKLNGQVKTCRVHDLIRDFCIDKAASDGVFQQIKMSYGGAFQPPVDEELKFRRLCIHSNALTFFSKKPNGPSVSSFVCSSREEIEMPMKDISNIPKGFKSLKVLDVQPINFNLKLPRDLFQLLHLKCLFLSVKISVLPSAFSQLLKIQTLAFNTSSRTLEIRADILSLTQLRHFKTKASSAMPETSTGSLTSTAGENFQTLGTISPESCTKDFFERVPNLKKLGVRGNLGLLLDGEKESFDSLGKLERLEKLKLLNDVFPIPPSGFPVLSLPPPNKFPPKLKILTLSRTCLDWRYMSIIGSLENLEVLKLEDKSFVGDTWKVSDGGFHCLEVLRIERVYFKNWSTFDNPFPKLKHLQLRHCDDLLRIPFELANVPSFWKLELFHCKLAVASAREIEAKIKHDMQPRNVVREFDLSISPFNFELFENLGADSDSDSVENLGADSDSVENLAADFVSAKMANMSNPVLLHLRRQYNHLTKVIMESTAERAEIEALLREFQGGQLHVDEEEGPSGAEDAEGHEVVPDPKVEGVDAETKAKRAGDDAIAPEA